jgi:hypothetical protein
LNKIRFIASLMLSVLILGVMLSCSQEDGQDNTIVTITANKDSDYEKAFKAMNLGIVFDFHMKETKADESWVKLWVEGYRDGVKMEPFHLTGISYGLSPNPIEEGHLGFGIINQNSESPLVFIYTPSGGMQPHSIEGFNMADGGISTWDHAILEDETMGLETGETKLLAVYRQGKGSMRTYDYQDPDSVQQMIEEDVTVLLFKIKVEEREEPF